VALSEWGALARLLVASGLTGLMGAEREIRRKEAGLRTFTLVGVGAGLIFRQGSHTKNLTTAAGVWAAAAVGMAAGAGLYILACGATAIILVALTVYGEIERRIERPGRAHHEDDPPGPDAQ
jgi:putative Mg2+ transporter-C (MgtC) family protein